MKVGDMRVVLRIKIEIGCGEINMDGGGKFYKKTKNKMQSIPLMAKIAIVGLIENPKF